METFGDFRRAKGQGASFLIKLSLSLSQARVVLPFLSPLLAVVAGVGTRCAVAGGREGEREGERERERKKERGGAAAHRRGGGGERVCMRMLK